MNDDEPQTQVIDTAYEPMPDNDDCVNPNLLAPAEATAEIKFTIETFLEFVRSELHKSRLGPGDEAEVQLNRDSTKPWINVKSKRFKDFLTRLAFKKFATPLSAGTLTLITGIISDEIIETNPAGGPSIQDVDEILRRPLIKCLLDYLERNETPLTIRATQLVTAINGAAHSLGHKDNEPWLTQSANVLGKRIRAHTSLLERLGVLATYTHKRDGRYWTFRRSEALGGDTSAITESGVVPPETHDHSTTYEPNVELTSETMKNLGIDGILGPLNLNSKENLDAV
ncbi:hypothetical protein K2Y11_18045 [bacterium]|nr:hypothetical protein [bacterium]